MDAIQAAGQGRETTLRQAALAAAVSLLVMAVLAPIAHMGIVPKLVVAGDAQQTVANLQASPGLFLAAIGCYLVTFVADVAAAWALYVFLAPVNRSVSLLAAWLRLVYTVVAVVALVQLVTVLRIVQTPEYAAAFGPAQLEAQVQLLVGSFRYGWQVGFVWFALHLALLGALVWRSGYVPRIFGVLLVVNGAGYLVDTLKPHLFPSASLPWLPALFFGELLFMVWLFARGARIGQVVSPDRSAPPERATAPGTTTR